MKKKSVFCIAASLAHASQIVDRLREVGFSNNDVSILLPDRSTSRTFAHEKNTKAPEGAAAGASAGGVLGGALGWLIGVGMLAVPGVGPFIAAGPILAALGGIGVGAAVGGIGGALIGLGVPEYEAKRYEGQIRDGGILISVHTEDSDEIARARAVFENSYARDIATASEVEPAETPTTTPKIAPGMQRGEVITSSVDTRHQVSSGALEATHSCRSWGLN